MYVLSQPIINNKTKQVVGMIGLQFNASKLLESVVSANIHKSEASNTIDFNFHQIVIFDIKSYN